MPARRSWVPTTSSVVEVTSTAQLLLPANPRARVRMVLPLFSRFIQIGLDSEECTGPAVTFLTPWRENALQRDDVMFRGDLWAKHDYPFDRRFPVFVLEAEED